MLRKEKIRIMTRLAAFESQEENSALRTARYYRVDFIRYEVLKTFFRVTVGYCILILMMVLYHLNAFIEGNLEFNYEQVSGQVLGGYFVLLTIYLCISLIVCNIKYNGDRKKIRKYKRRLKILRKYQ